MKKQNLQKAFTAFFISLLSMAVGFLLISLPFHLFDTLNPVQMKIVFAVEMLVYFSIFATVILNKEKHEKKAKDDKARRQERRIKETKNCNAMHEALFSVMKYDVAA